MSDTGRMAVIGAGVAGLAAARTLVRAGHRVTVFDKGRGPGGRISSRRAEPFAFDHGAQYFTARDPEFREALGGWLANGVVARWSGRIAALDGGPPRILEGTERFVGVPSMSSLAKHLARDLDVRTKTHVGTINRDSLGWRLEHVGGEDLGAFDGLVVTAPPAQAAELVGDRSPLGARAATIPMQPCHAVLLGFAAPFTVDFDGAFCTSAALSWISRNNSKPGRPAAEAWVLHATPEWTRAHLEAPRSEVIEGLLRELEDLTGQIPPALVHRDAHRWLYARPAEEEAGLHLVDGERALALAGDGYCGGRVEGAWRSGVAAALALG